MTSRILREVGEASSTMIRSCRCKLFPPSQLLRLMELNVCEHSSTASFVVADSSVGASMRQAHFRSYPASTAKLTSMAGLTRRKEAPHLHLEQVQQLAKGGI